MLEALGGKAVGSKEKRRNTCDCGGALEEVTARRIAQKFHGAVGPGSGRSRVDWPERGGGRSRGPAEQNPQPVPAVDKDHTQETKPRAEKPKTRQDRNQESPPDDVYVA